MEEMPTRSTAEREKILCASNPSSVAIQYSDVLNMKRAERRELVGGKEGVHPRRMDESASSFYWYGAG